MFWTRLLSGVILLVMAFLALGYGGIPLVGILCLISLVAFRELIRVMKCTGDGKRAQTPEIVGYAGIAVYYAAAYFTAKGGMDHRILLAVILAVFLGQLFVYVLQFETELPLLDSPLKEVCHVRSEHGPLTLELLVSYVIGVLAGQFDIAFVYLV